MFKLLQLRKITSCNKAEFILKLEASAFKNERFYDVSLYRRYNVKISLYRKCYRSWHVKTLKNLMRAIVERF